MPLYGYIMVRWLPGGHETFGGTLNSLVHVFMYSYYFLASLGPQMQKYLWWKKYLTTLQMIQFIIVFVRSIIVIFGIVECGYPRYFSLFSASITLLFFAMFMNFYRENYSKKKTQKYRDWMKKRLQNSRFLVKNSSNLLDSGTLTNFCLFICLFIPWKQKTEIFWMGQFHFRHKNMSILSFFQKIGVAQMTLSIFQFFCVSMDCWSQQPIFFTWFHEKSAFNSRSV